jgi:ribosome modulation factor
MKLDKSAYEAGYAAYFDERNCPSEDPDYAESWMEGYYDAEEDSWEDVDEDAEDE